MGNQENQEQTQVQRACLCCGKLVSADDYFCVSCGRDLKATPRPGRAGSVPVPDFEGARRAGEGDGAYAPPGTFAYGPVSRYAAGPYQAGYPPPTAYGAPIFMVRKTDEMAIISFICAIAGFVVFPFIPAVAAIILGLMARDRIGKNPVGLEGEGLALAGIILGLVNAILVAGLVILLAVLTIYNATLLLG